jgi:2-oxoglutarate dehydrogenase E2 component (dihydrolipoamide succinyltransferase)
MSIEVRIPAVGESITSGVLSGWHKQNGDLVKDGEALFTLETDKISTEVPASGSGRLEIKVDAGQEVKIGQVVALLYEDAAVLATGSAPVSSDQSPGQIASRGDSEPGKEPAASGSSGAGSGPVDFGPLPPSVRRIAEEEGVNLADVKGTGKHGYVTKSDLVQYLESKGAKAGAHLESGAPKQTAPPVAPTAPIERTARTTRRKLTPLRKKIAVQLVLAQQNAAMLTTFNECDMSAVMKLRSQYQEMFQKKHGVKLGFMSFFLKAAVEALIEVPAMNARIDGDDLVENHYYDIGVAVGTERGLVVPVVRDADKKNFAELEKDVASYAKKARDGKLQLDDLTGGVFTITNGGIYGSLLSTPILNPPQSGILGMHKIQNRPVVVDDAVVVRPMMYLALSYDHRVVDGKEAVTFLVRMKECIEDPTRLLLQG